LEKEKASSFLIPSPLSIWPASPFSRRPASLLLFPLFLLPSWASPLGRAGHCSAPAQQARRPSTAATAAAPSLCQPGPTRQRCPSPPAVPRPRSVKQPPPCPHFGHGSVSPCAPAATNGSPPEPLPPAVSPLSLALAVHGNHRSSSAEVRRPPLHADCRP